MAAASGQPASADGLALLLADHQRFKELFKQFQKGCGGPSGKRGLVETLTKEILAHASAEERHVYPLLKSSLPNGSMVAESHYVDDKLIMELMALVEKLEPVKDGELYDSTLLFSFL